MSKDFNWNPRHNMVVLKAVLKNDIKNRKVEVVDSDGNHYKDDYDYYVEDMGPDVLADLEVGSEVYCNLYNVNLIHGTTNRKQDITYFIVNDNLIQLWRAPVTILK